MKCALFFSVFEDEIFVFRGIPYAVPPVGNRRWQYADPLDSLEKCWNGTLRAHNNTPMCWQLLTTTNGKERIDGAENCLTLDVI